MGYVFFGAAVTYREVYLVEGMITLGLFFMMMYALYLTKQDPGSIRQDGTQDAYMRTVNYQKGKLKPRGQTHSRYHSLGSINTSICKFIYIFSLVIQEKGWFITSSFPYQYSCLINIYLKTTLIECYFIITSCKVCLIDY